MAQPPNPLSILLLRQHRGLEAGNALLDVGDLQGLEAVEALVEAFDLHALETVKALLHLVELLEAGQTLVHPVELDPELHQLQVGRRQLRLGRHFHVGRRQLRLSCHLLLVRSHLRTQLAQAMDGLVNGRSAGLLFGLNEVEALLVILVRPEVPTDLVLGSGGDVVRRSNALVDVVESLLEAIEALGLLDKHGVQVLEGVVQLLQDGALLCNPRSQAALLDDFVQVDFLNSDGQLLNRL